MAEDASKRGPKGITGATAGVIGVVCKIVVVERPLNQDTTNVVKEDRLEERLMRIGSPCTQASQQRAARPVDVHGDPARRVPQKPFRPCPDEPGRSLLRGLEAPKVDRQNRHPRTSALKNKR